MEWTIIILMAFIPVLYRINKRIYTLEKKVENQKSCLKQRYND